MKKPSEIWDTPEATGFDRVNTKDIEESEVGTAKDYAHQIITAFKHLEHGVSHFHDQPVMEAGEEDMMYDIIINALTQHYEAEVERAYERGVADGAEKPLLAIENVREAEREKFERAIGKTIMKFGHGREELKYLIEALTPTKTDKQTEV